MKKRIWFHVVLAILVTGLFFTVSCAKKTVVSDASTIEKQDGADDAAAKAKADAELRARELAEQAAKERAQQEAMAQAARQKFENQDIHFAFDSSELTAMAKTLLQEKADWLKQNAAVSVTIEGHCDERGTTEYNLALGERRASAAKNYLVDLGVSASRLNTISYGEEKPLDDGKNESAWAKNRRAHFAID